MRTLALLAAVAALSPAGGRQARPAEGPKDEAAKKYAESLKGEWQMTSRIDNGEPSPAELVKKRTITFEADRYTVRDGDKVVVHSGHDSLAAPWDKEYTMILANPPFGKSQAVEFVNEEGDLDKEDAVV